MIGLEDVIRRAREAMPNERDLEVLASIAEAARLWGIAEAEYSSSAASAHTLALAGGKPDFDHLDALTTVCIEAGEVLKKALDLGE